MVLEGCRNYRKRVKSVSLIRARITSVLRFPYSRIRETTLSAGLHDPLACQEQCDPTVHDPVNRDCQSASEIAHSPCPAMSPLITMLPLMYILLVSSFPDCCLLSVSSDPKPPKKPQAILSDST
jgi:hypothetical protein